MTEEENEIIAKYDYEQFLDMEEYKKEHPDDPYCKDALDMDNVILPQSFVEILQ